MNLRQAYDGWSQQSQNKQLYVKTRDAFRRAWFTLPTNKPCSWYTKDVLALALAETRVVESDKVKAASVMVHVLTWANFAEPKWNPKPDFETKDVTRLIHLPADKLEKERERINAAMLAMLEKEQPKSDDGNTSDDDADPLAGIDFDDKKQVADALMEQSARIMNDKPKGDNPTNETIMEEKKQGIQPPKAVVQMDAETLQPIKTWESVCQAERELHIKNITRAILKHSMAGGYYWSRPKDIGEFKPAKKHNGGRPSKPKQEKPAPDKVSVSVAASAPTLADYTDDELLEELDRRGWEGELSRRQVVTIGSKD